MGFGYAIPTDAEVADRRRDGHWSLRRGVAKVMITLLLVDDQPGVLAGLKMQLGLEDDLVVVGEAANGAEALYQAGALRPDVAVMDVRMPGVDGIQATRILRELHPQCRVVILTLHDDAATRAQALAAGAAAFVAKHEPGDRLVKAIRQAAASRAA